MTDPLPDPADLTTPRFTLRGAHISVHLNDIPDPLPELFALADRMLVSQNIVP